MKRVTTPRRLVLASAAVGTGAIAVGALSFGALTTAALRRGARRSVATPAAAFSGSSAPSAPQVRPQPPPAPPLAMVLVLDRSGSMTATDTEPRGQQTRMALAIEGARRALRTVTLGDLVGVISFDYDARWVADVRHIRGVSDIQDVDQRLDLIRADGGTDIYRALELAYRGLQQVYAKAKHVILLTDGEQGSPAPFPTLVGAMQRAGISVSTIGISSTGSAASTLRNIAGLGQGRFHVVRSAAELPDVVAGEAHTFVSLARPETVYPS